MNEQVYVLLYESGLTAQGCWDTFDEYDQSSVMKLAEMIVLECMDQCFSDDYIRIAKHFGIELEEE